MEFVQPCTTVGEKDAPPDFPGTMVPAPWTTLDMQTAKITRTKFKGQRIMFIVVFPGSAKL
jgi:hypothetical protein